MAKKDYGFKIGDIIGLQKILEMDVYNPESKAKVKQKMYKCECVNCKKITYKRAYDLSTGRNISCRCNANRLTSIRNTERSSVKVGNIYGHLEVKEDLGFRLQPRGKQEKWYRCYCHNCGNNNFETNGNNLQSGRTRSCGCIHSHGENYIEGILKQHNYNYIKEYTFEDLVSDKNNKYKLRFDFAVFKNNKLAYLIEFDGRQHYYGPDTTTWTHSIPFEEIKKRDKIKNEYCIKHNIPLIRIPYTHYEDLKIEDLLLNTTTFKI